VEKTTRRSLTGWDAAVVVTTLAANLEPMSAFGGKADILGSAT